VAEAGEPETLCFAYIVRGDVILRCGGSKTQLTAIRGIRGFAVGDEHWSYEPKWRLLASGETSSMTYVIDLRTGSRKDNVDVSDVVRSCGTFYALPRFPVDGVRLDLITGEMIAFPPYETFLCSADRKTVIGMTDYKESALTLGVPPSITIAPAKKFDRLGFAVSPNGKNIAYYSDRGILCVYIHPGTTHCARMQESLVGRPSVNDAGEVLVSAGSLEECYYAGWRDFFPKPRQGDDQEDRDQCLTVGYWKPGLDSIRIIEPLGAEPQWVSPHAARLLRELARRNNRSIGRKQ